MFDSFIRKASDKHLQSFVLYFFNHSRQATIQAVVTLTMMGYLEQSGLDVSDEEVIASIDQELDKHLVELIYLTAESKRQIFEKLHGAAKSARSIHGVNSEATQSAIFVSNFAHALMKVSAGSVNRAEFVENFRSNLGKTTGNTWPNLLSNYISVTLTVLGFNKATFES